MKNWLKLDSTSFLVFMSTTAVGMFVLWLFGYHWVSQIVVIWVAVAVGRVLEDEIG